MNIKFKLLPLSIAIATVLTPLAASADDSLTFSGYARYGAYYSTSDAGHLIGAPGGIQNKGVGRLGNNMNGGEFQFTKDFGTAENGTKWQLGIMLEHWNQDVQLKKFYAKATNVFASQPNATVWAGRDFHQRPQTSLTDFYYMSHDGQGIGITDLEFGGVKLDFAGVAQANSSDDKGGVETVDSGNYAITSKLHGIDLGGAQLAILANYGFSSDTSIWGGAVENPDLQAASVAGILTMGPHKVVARYANNNAGDGASVFNKEGGTDSYYLGFESNYYASDAFRVEYAVAYAGQTYATAGDKNDFSFIARPMYAWDNIHSTWLEAGYEFVDQDGMDDASAFKVTLSQNISINGVAGRPIIRLYVSAGQEDDGQETTDKVGFGGMFEAWW